MLVLFLRPCDSVHRSTSSIFACELKQTCMCVCGGGGVWGISLFSLPHDVAEIVLTWTLNGINQSVYMDVCTDQSVQTVFVWIGG